MIAAELIPAMEKEMAGKNGDGIKGSKEPKTSGED